MTWEVTITFFFLLSLQTDTVGQTGTCLQSLLIHGLGQDEDLDMAPPGMVSSTVDPDGGGRPKKKAVRISAWRLAKLNAQEVSRAAAKARDKSSVLQKLGTRDAGSTAPENYYSSSSNMSSSRSAVSMEYALQRSLKRASQKMLTPRGVPSLNPELSRAGAPVAAGYVDSDLRSSISSHSITSTISESLSPLPAEIRYGPSENQFSMDTVMPSASSTVLPSPAAAARTSWSAAPPWGVQDDAVRPSRERNVFLRDHRRSAVFWNRPGLGRFGGDPGAVVRPQSRISFGGSGISTSTFPSQVVRTWPKNPLAAHPDVSESDSASAPAPSPVELPSQVNNNNAPESFSIFFGPPIVPVGAGKRAEAPPPPPAASTEPRGGVHIQSRPPSIVPRSVTPRSESPTFVSRNKP